MAVKRTVPPKKIMSTGAGPSKHFGGAEIAPGVGDDRKFLPDGTRDLSGYTVNGEPLPRECWDTFPVSLTDQAKADMERERKDLPVSYQGRDGQPFDYSNVRDDDKKLDKFRDDLKTQPAGIVSRDALRQLMDKHLPKGHRGLWMGKRKTDEAGMFRDELEYQPVYFTNDQGQREQVKAGGMFLASVPEHLARQQEQLNQDRAREREVSTSEKVQEQSEKIIGTRELNEIARRRRTLEDLSGSVEDNPDAAMSEIMAHEGA